MTDSATELMGVDQPEESQHSLPLTPIAPPTEGEMKGIMNCPTLSAVYRWMIQRLSDRVGEIYDKQLAAHLNVDPAHFSRVVTHGTSSFNFEQEERLMRLCGSGAPVWWRLHRMGLDATTVRPLESEYERQIRELREENERLKQDRAVISRALRGEWG